MSVYCPKIANTQLLGLNTQSITVSCKSFHFTEGLRLALGLGLGLAITLRNTVFCLAQDFSNLVYCCFITTNLPF